MLGKYFHSSPEQYLQEALRKYEQEHGPLKKYSTPMGSLHPEEDKSPLLDLKEVKHFQKIVGICHWLIVCGRIDICYATASLSRFQAAPREGHLGLARKILRYLKKYKKEVQFKASNI